MAHHPPPPPIACYNAPDVRKILAEVVLGEGFRAVTHVAPSSLGPAPTIAFLTQVQPQAGIYSVSQPYEESWTNFQQVRAALPRCAWVVTTTIKRTLDKLAGLTNTIEIWGKPFNIDDIVAAVRRALAQVEQPHDDPTEVPMRRNTVGGYQGPVEILTCEDVLVGQAACRYRAEEDAAGVDHWQGRLHRINAPDGVQAGSYRLRFDGGRHGDIRVGPVVPSDRVVYFDGVGARPLS